MKNAAYSIERRRVIITIRTDGRCNNSSTARTGGRTPNEMVMSITNRVIARKNRSILNLHRD